MTAFAMATTVAELYPENKTLQIVSYACASLVGVGVSTNIHWFSDAVGGALIGYSIGKTVGSGFRELMDSEKGSSSLSVAVIPKGITISYHF
jgi:membrane-associated phospholipid phosphatase